MKTLNFYGVPVSVSNKEYNKYIKATKTTIEGAKNKPNETKTKAKSSTLSIPDEPKTKSATVTLPDEARDFMGKDYKGTQVGYLSDACCVCYSHGVYRLFITTPIKKQFTAIKISANEALGKKSYSTKFAGDFKNKKFYWDFKSKEAAKAFIEKQRAYDEARG